jgi:hypothetical protein
MTGGKRKLKLGNEIYYTYLRAIGRLNLDRLFSCLAGNNILTESLNIWSRRCRLDRDNRMNRSTNDCQLNVDSIIYNLFYDIFASQIG